METWYRNNSKMDTMKSLDELGVMFGTDKSSRGHSYLQYYEMFFDPLRYRPINLLEIGIDKGDSVRTWKEYFPHSEIHGIDIRGDYEYLNQEGIKTHIVDQSKLQDLLSFGVQYDQYFDIIIDDGSHQSDDMILSFKTLFPFLKSGGFYCVEDLLCDYDDRWNKGTSAIRYFERRIGDVHMNGSIPNDSICADKKVKSKKHAKGYFEENIEYIFTSCGLVIIKKV